MKDNPRGYGIKVERGRRNTLTVQPSRGSPQGMTTRLNHRWNNVFSVGELQTPPSTYSLPISSKAMPQAGHPIKDSRRVY